MEDDALQVPESRVADQLRRRAAGHRQLENLVLVGQEDGLIPDGNPAKRVIVGRAAEQFGEIVIVQADRQHPDRGVAETVHSGIGQVNRVALDDNMRCVPAIGRVGIPIGSQLFHHRRRAAQGDLEHPAGVVVVDDQQRRFADGHEFHVAGRSDRRAGCLSVENLFPDSALEWATVNSHPRSRQCRVDVVEVILATGHPAGLVGRRLDIDVRAVGRDVEDGLGVEPAADSIEPRDVETAIAGAGDVPGGLEPCVGRKWLDTDGGVTSGWLGSRQLDPERTGLADVVSHQRIQVGERVQAILVGHGLGFTRIPPSVVIVIQEDFPVFECRFPGIPDSITVVITEHRTVDFTGDQCVPEILVHHIPSCIQGNDMAGRRRGCL